jgi:DNA-binding XRE family transcriptional regulator
MESRANNSNAKAPMITIAIGIARFFQTSFSKVLALKNVKAIFIS